ncbi:MAG: hypothetical protein KDC54_25030 [Lewinella sp.]|nr:hypothetical protein [Lewinella sp.]
MKYAFWVLLISLSCQVHLYAQRTSNRIPVTDVSGNNSQGGQRGANQREIAPDTFGIFQFQVNNPNEETPFSDSLLANFHQFDPTRQGRFDYANLGILGSAHQPIVYQPRKRGGLDLGFHQYDLYYITGETMPFYRLERPYTNLRFIQGTQQSDTYLSAIFSRNFANGLNFVVDYRRIAQKSESSQYPNQQNEQTGVASGFWYHSPGGRYDGFLTYAANTIRNEDNGGVYLLPVTGGEFSTPASAEVFLNDGQTRYALREGMYTHFYRFGGQLDTTGRSRRAFTLNHQISWQHNTYKYADDFDLADTAFFNWYPDLLTDVRGVRYLIDQKQLENSVRLSTYRLTSGRRSDTRQQRDLFEVGLTHRYNKLYQEPVDSVVNNLMLTGKLTLRLGERLLLEGDGFFGLLDQVGDYRVTGALGLDLGRAGRFRFTLNNQLYTPTVLQERFIVTQQTVWQQDLKKTLETNLGATYALPRWQITLGGNYHLLNEFIYFDTTGQVRQTGVPLSILQLFAQKNFSFGPFHLANTLVFQQASDEVLRLPTLFGKHSLYYAGHWFKVLDVQMGIDLRYTTRYRADYYNPVTGQFNLQDRAETPFYPNADVYVSLKVSRFRFFLKFENATTWIDDQQRLFLSAYAPWPAASMRFGVNWRMID